MIRIPSIVVLLIGFISAKAVTSRSSAHIFHQSPPKFLPPALPADHLASGRFADAAFFSKLEISFREKSLSLTKRQGNPTRDDLINGACNGIIIIFARGTGGAGNIGLGLGPSFVAKVEAALPGRVIVQGVLPYTADILGYLQGGSVEGGRSMKALTERAATQCPDAEIVLSGYSQGAQVTHLAAGLLSPTLSRRIAAIVTFGDPKRDDAFPSTLNSKSLVICNSGDLICDGQPIVKEEHSSQAYEARVPEAVAWIKARISPRNDKPSSSTSSSITTTIATTISTSALTEIIPNSTTVGLTTTLSLVNVTSTNVLPASTSTSTVSRIRIPRTIFLAAASALIAFGFL
ncbi:cutinase-domain-containing protein [Terfezia boudieri ATCC MYA-4762]|uniref:Cutinase n=1 Tax=Terfezia boudieri ATCC MYA-4762 TaxID=1051890 RepID=A0A3N4LWJ9_9PEZI|nr:cutinase-domain-containing protein [Terfezia boudieri ATCC MYA-4762]